MMVYSGYMLPYPMIPQYLRWVYDISIYAYIYNGQSAISPPSAILAPLTSLARCLPACLAQLWW